MTEETMPAAFIRALPSWVSHPLLGFDPDGDVSMDWICRSDYLSISVSREGSIAYAWILRLEVGHGSLSFTDHGIPKELDEVFYRMRGLVGVKP